MSGWGYVDRPAPTITNSVFRGIVGGSGARASLNRAIAGGGFVLNGDNKTRLDHAEAGILQTYPVGFVWPKNSTDTGLQVGNSVPPLLAGKVLGKMWSKSEEAMSFSEHKVLDLFAGTGVGVAIQQLGATEYGVEIMPAAIATREANGMETIYNDVWDAHLAEGLEFDTLWASPPCQTFSLAGKGAGRKALDDVLGIVERKQYTDIGELREQSDLLGDDRIGLVLSPLYYVHRFRPTYVVLEQVPPVLPVWKAIGLELEGMGYSVWVGYLHAEQYGVPQTRKRAYLIARSDGVVAEPPVPTHSKYYSHDPKRLDIGVQKWVSMVEALGQDRVTTDEVAVWRDRPATTVVSSSVLAGPGSSIFVKGGVSRQDRVGSIQVSVGESGRLQSYPDGFIWGKGARLQVGNAVPTLQAGAVLSGLWEKEEQ